MLGFNMGHSPLKEALLRKPRKKRTIVCEGLDFIWDEPELVELAEMWNQGSTIEWMAKYFKRNDPDEVLFALIHIAREDRIGSRRSGLKGEL